MSMVRVIYHGSRWALVRFIPVLVGLLYVYGTGHLSWFSLGSGAIYSGSRRALVRLNYGQIRAIVRKKGKVFPY